MFDYLHSEQEHSFSSSVTFNGYILEGVIHMNDIGKISPDGESSTSHFPVGIVYILGEKFCTTRTTLGVGPDQDTTINYIQ